jgi:hypothetical protein
MGAPSRAEGQGRAGLAATPAPVHTVSMTASTDAPTPGDTARGERRFLLVVVIGGILLRLLWLGQTHGIDAFLNASEATRVALAFARTGSIADAYFPGQGPTAHLLPLNPMISGAILWLFGPGSTGANLTLVGWALAQVCCSYLLLRRLFERLGADAATLRWGTALLFLLLPFVPQETVDFRYWEGASALCLAGVNLLLIVEVDQRRVLGWRGIATIAAVSALTFFVSPAVGLAIDACWAVVALRRLPLLRSVQLACAAATALAVLVVPWTLRNERVLGEPVATRSNFGMELALANHPAAVSGRAPEYVFADRVAELTPSANAALRPVIAERGGEVRYSRGLADETWRWIGANPGSFAMLWLRHLREFFFPRPWQMYFTGWEGMREARAWTISLVNLLGLIGLALGLLARRRGYWILALYVAMIALPYALFQPMSRYIFLAYPLLAFPAIEAVAQAWRLGRARMSRA